MAHPRYPRSLRCWFCGRTLTRKTRTMDHLIPRSHGGNNSKQNLVQACRNCNETKGSLHLDEFRLVMAFRRGLIKLPDFRFPGELVELESKRHAHHPSKQERYAEKETVQNEARKRNRP